MLKREESAGYMTNWAARLFTRAIDRRIRPLGLAPAYLPIFFALGDGGSMSQKDIVGRAAVEQPTMAATLSRMERDGLVARKADPDDRRISLYALTPPALKLVKDVQQAAVGTNRAALAGLSTEERATFFALMGRIVENLVRLDAEG